jgi:hypothetical protein
MSVPSWVAELVRTFWAEAGMSEAFPRTLRRPTLRALPVSIIPLPRLRLDKVRGWLHENGISCPCVEPDRSLRACLVAHRGHGLIFLDEADEADEQRFSLAHELAHFLKHYWQPRRLACLRLGARIAEVFDGARPPTVRERLHALLKNVQPGFQLHLMQRGPGRGMPTQAIARAEEEADLVAYELLAPAAEVLARIGGVLAQAAKVAAMLRTDFGLPEQQAMDYARDLLPSVWEDPLLRRLRS